MFRLVHQLSGWLRTPRALRWLALGIVTAGFNLGLLYLLVDGLGISFLIAPVVSGEISLVLRFLANDRWVFGHPRPTWKRLAIYHVAVAGGFLVWWVTSNILVLLGFHYLLASVMAISGSISFNLISNFFWIWRQRPHPARTDRPQP
jgi:putative flippase GtrA